MPTHTSARLNLPCLAAGQLQKHVTLNEALTRLDSLIQTAVLSRLSRLVYTVERYRTLMKEAEERFRTLGLVNVITRFGDGGEGWAEQAPFDRIMVTAAAPEEPKRLLAQLKPNGVLVAPIGKGPVQSLRRYAGDGQGGFKVELLGDVRFVPLLDGVAREL
jgi:protein-L-isoaspartate(D-aspartate) O-methyltransferase